MIYFTSHTHTHTHTHKHKLHINVNKNICVLNKNVYFIHVCMRNEFVYPTYVFMKCVCVCVCVSKSSYIMTKLELLRMIGIPPYLLFTINLMPAMEMIYWGLCCITFCPGNLYFDAVSYGVCPCQPL
jgi:hypothetical protein